MKITKVISATLELDNDEFQVLSDICEIIRRCLDNEVNNVVPMISDFTSDQKRNIAEFIQVIFN